MLEGRPHSGRQPLDPDGKGLLMSLVCGVYGYQITRPIVLSGLRIEPRTSDFHQAQEWARDLDAYHMTSVIVADSISDERLFDLEAILSFVEHLDVLITAPVELTKEDPFAHLTQVLKTHRRNNGGGAVIGDDTFFPDSRGMFVAKALERVADPVFCEMTQFRALFFKCVETFRQRKPFIEVSYFLLYSGLESHARAVLNDRVSSSAVPIFKLLST